MVDDIGRQHASQSAGEKEARRARDPLDLISQVAGIIGADMRIVFPKHFRVAGEI